MGLRMKSVNIFGVHWKIWFLGVGVHKKPIQRGDCLKRGAWTVCRFQGELGKKEGGDTPMHTMVMYQKLGGVCRQSTENQFCISLHLKADQWCKNCTTQVVSLNNCDQFLTVLVYMQEQQNCSQKTWHICIAIVSNGSSKISFVSLLKKILCFDILYYVLVSWFAS